MLLLKLDAQSKEPIYRQIVRQIIDLVEGDTVKEGEALPPSRELAQRLSVSRFTVAQAYRELWAKGYVDSRPGSYTRVRKRPKLAAGTSARRYAEGELDGIYSASARALEDAKALATFPVGRTAAADVIDFTPLALDTRLFPVDELRTSFDRVLTQRHASLLNYADPAGYAPLREYVADRMRMHAVEAEPDEVLITHGSLQGLDLVTRLFVDPGRTVAIEQPTFPSVMPLFLVRGARLGAIPMTEGGMDLDALEALIRERAGRADALSLIYSIPTFHNPNGISTSQPHRERLLALCEEHRVPLAEDSFQEEITYFGKAVLPIKSMDSRGLVFYLGSFSKVLFPGVRMGWVLARRDCIERLTLLKRVEDISCSPLMQAALHRFCESGAYELHLRRINRIFAKRMAAAMAALRLHLPAEKASFDEPSGGYLIWIRLRGMRRSEGEIQTALRRAGVAAAQGSLFFARSPDPPSGEPPSGRSTRRGPASVERYLRLSISSLDIDEIEEGIRRLGGALAQL